jgi:hypothetical protein
VTNLRTLRADPRKANDFPPWLVATAMILAALVALGVWKVAELMGVKP